jgi:hypothetical protein
VRTKLIWTDDMVTALRNLRAGGMPLLLCAEEIGVSYPLTVYKARELGLSKRINSGRTAGRDIATGVDPLRSVGGGAQHRCRHFVSGELLFTSPFG